MSLLSGLKKIFAKKDPCTPPNEFKLNHKEKGSVIILFILGCIVLISTILYYLLKSHLRITKIVQRCFLFNIFIYFLQYQVP